MKRTCLMMLMLALAVPMAGYADITWFNTATNRIAGSDGVTPLTGDTTGFPQNGSISCFVQLIWTGTDDVIDLAAPTGNGVTDNDVVYAVGFVAQNTWADGYLFPPTLSLGDMGAHNVFYVRAWNAPTTFTGSVNDLVPTGATVRYGDSPTWAYVYSATEPTGFNFGGTGNGNNIGWATTLTAIPEPTLIGLSLVGLAVLRLRKRAKAS